MKKFGNHIFDFLRAISQSYFFDNAYFGAGFLILLLIFDRMLLLGGLTGALIGYGYSVRFSTPKALKASGLLPINGLFFGLAMAALFARSPAFFFCLLAGSLAMPLLTKAAFEVLQHWKLSPLITPYILAIWVLWLCGQGTTFGLQPGSWNDGLAFVSGLPAEWQPVHRLFWSTFESMGRLVFLPNPVFGLFSLALVAAFSPRRALFFVTGTLVACGASFFLATGTPAWEHGFLSYGAGLVGLGLASFPEKFTARTILLFCMISVFLTMAMDRLLGRLELPILSVPYVLTMWFALLSRIPRVSISWAQPKPNGLRTLQGAELDPYRAASRTEETEKAA